MKHKIGDIIKRPNGMFKFKVLALRRSRYGPKFILQNLTNGRIYETHNDGRYILVDRGISFRHILNRHKFK